MHCLTALLNALPHLATHGAADDLRRHHCDRDEQRNPHLAALHGGALGHLADEGEGPVVLEVGVEVWAGLHNQHVALLERHVGNVACDGVPLAMDAQHGCAIGLPEVDVLQTLAGQLVVRHDDLLQCGAVVTNEAGQAYGRAVTRCE